MPNRAPDIQDVRAVVEYCVWFAQKAEAEFPGLQIVTAIYTDESWAQCREALIADMNTRFPDAAQDSIKEMTEKSGSQACVLYPFSSGGSERTIVMKINLDNCRSGLWGDPVTEAKAVVSHEGGHVAGREIRGVHNSLFEENAADLFETMFMSWLGHQENANSLLRLRVLNLEEPEKLGVSRRYGFPAVYEDAAALSADYHDRQGQEIPLRKFVEEADSFVEARDRPLNAWFGFFDGMSALSGETKNAADILGAAVKANHPHAGIISRVTGDEPNMDFEPAHKPNPFLSRMAAIDYHSKITFPVTVSKSGGRTDTGRMTPPWPAGYVLLLTGAEAEGTYDLKFETGGNTAQDMEPHFS